MLKLARIAPTRPIQQHSPASHPPPSSQHSPQHKIAHLRPLSISTSCSRGSETTRTVQHSTRTRPNRPAASPSTASPPPRALRTASARIPSLLRQLTAPALRPRRRRELETTHTVRLRDEHLGPRRRVPRTLALEAAAVVVVVVEPEVRRRIAVRRRVRRPRVGERRAVERRVCGRARGRRGTSRGAGQRGARASGWRSARAHTRGRSRPWWGLLVEVRCGRMEEGGRREEEDRAAREMSLSSAAELARRAHLLESTSSSRCARPSGSTRPLPKVVAALDEPRSLPPPTRSSSHYSYARPAPSSFPVPHVQRRS